MRELISLYGSRDLLGVIIRCDGGIRIGDCPKHLNLKAEDYVCTKVDVKCVDNWKL